MRINNFFATFLLLLILPSSAYAGAESFLLGFVAGGIGKTDSNIVAPEGIPPICIYLDNFEEYAKCRLPSARFVSWVTDDNSAKRLDGKYMGMSEFLSREWSLLEAMKRIKK